MYSLKPFFLAVPSLLFMGHGPALAADVSPSMLKIERFSAERGDAQSQYFIGEHYELGDSGVTQDLSIALDWYRKAANQGSAAAQFKIGLFYEMGYLGLTGGRGVAIDWYKQAVENGSEEAARKLAAFQKEREDERRRDKLQAERLKQQQIKAKRQKEREKVLRASKPAMAALPLRIPTKEPEVVTYPVSETIQQLLATKWMYEGHPAEFLPTKDMSCLKTSEEEITCFSAERVRVIGVYRLSYTAKSVINNFTPDRGFTAAYYFNVAEMEEATTASPSADYFGLEAKEGWQQPGINVECHLDVANHVSCNNSGQQVLEFDAE